MPRRFFGSGALAITLALAAISPLRAAPPKWLIEAAARPTPPEAAGAPAYLLLKHDSVEISPQGARTITQRFAFRVLTSEGAKAAEASLVYIQGMQKVLGSGVWLLRAGKEVKPVKKREWADVLISMDGAAYSEYRRRTIDYGDMAFAGDVFGYEGTVTGGALFAQENWQVESWWPAAEERYSLTLPPGWTPRVRTRGDMAGALQHSVSGQTLTWALRDLPFRPDEPWAPRAGWAHAVVSVNYAPEKPVPGYAAPAFRDWREVATWSSAIAAGQCDASPAFAAEAQRITRDAPDALTKIRALARHVQSLRYVSVTQGLGLGFGYKPRKATEVLAKGWGDCKDKANLLRALLREAGIRSYPAGARIGGGRFIDPEWPTMHAFNHAILAIEVDDAIDLPAVVSVAGIGRLLFFDPTDPHTVVGQLPRILQGTRVLLDGDGGENLVTLPVFDAASAAVVRRVTLKVDTTGAIAGGSRWSFDGAAGTRWRAMRASASTRENELANQTLLGDVVRGARVTAVAPADNLDTGRYELAFDFTAPAFVQFMGGGLALARLDVFSRASVPAFPERERRLPVELPPLHQTDELELEIPQGWVVDELPKTVTLTSPFGSYENTFSQRDGTIQSRRVLHLEEGLVATADYPRLRQFLLDAAKADRAAAVLKAPR